MLRSSLESDAFLFESFLIELSSLSFDLEILF